MNAMVFNIQRFSINDGPGIRTTVFLKGCPLNCVWCHNPESKRPYKELLFTESKCVSCGRCFTICPTGSHIMEGGKHVIRRDLCTMCGKCVTVCMGNALEIAGKSMSAEEVLHVVMKDEPYYRSSGGGMTISGGEPLLHPEFTLELTKGGKEKGLHICVETCGYADFSVMEALLTYVDIFLYDYKETNPDKHKEYTGVSNKKIIDNLLALDEAEAMIVLRCPIIQGMNDRPDHFEGIAEMANRLKNLLSIEVEPYHPLGKKKSEKLGREYPLGDLGFAGEDMVKNWIEVIQSMTKLKVQKA